MARPQQRAKKPDRHRKERRARRRARKRLLGRLLLLGVTGTVVIALIFGVVFFLSNPTSPRRTESASTRLGPGENPTIQDVEHISEGESHPSYNSKPATSGWHRVVTVPWGIYQQTLPDEVTVHNLEHGGVAMQYNTDDRQLISQIEDLARRQRRFPCYLIVAPYPGMKETIALTAWGAIQYFEGYDEARMQRFIESYLNDGPEEVSCSQ